MPSLSVRRDRKRKAMRRRESCRRNRQASHSTRRRLAASIEPLEARYLLAFTTSLFADINQLGVSARPDSFIEFNNEAFFVADDGETGSELWKSDGTLAGTARVADLLPGPDGSQPADLTIVGSELFFTALDNDDEVDLWKSDGTTSGTVKVFDADASGVYYLSDLTASGGKLFFTAYEPATGYEIWTSDGTSGGTALVKDINSDQTVIDRPQELTDVNGTLFFTTYQVGYYNRELFKSDGTAAGTLLVSDIDGDPLESSNPSNLTNVGGVLYFAAEDLTDGVELYKSDGTASGTVQVANLSATGSSYPEELTPFNGQLFFSASDGVIGRQLYRSDGITISLVEDTTGVGAPSNPLELTVVGSELFFSSIGGAVAGPTSAVTPTLNPSPNSNSFRANSSNAAAIAISTSFPDRPLIRTATSSGLTFTARVGGQGKIGDAGVGLTGIDIDDLVLQDVDGSDLQVDAWDWTVTDPAGLTSIDFSGFASGNEFQNASEGLLFELFLNGSAVATTTTEVTGAALDDWAGTRSLGNVSLSDPGGPTVTSATVRLTFRNEMPDDSVESIVVGAILSATGTTSGTAGRELFKSDGTAAGTDMVKNIVFVGSSNPSELTEVNGQLMFSANDPLSSGRELWVSDGTEPGTTLVQDIRTGTDVYGAPLSGDPRNLTEINGQLIFSVIDDLDDRELWSSDGTAANTNLVKNINTRSQGANIRDVTLVGNKVFFIADDGINGEAVWVADPAAGTAQIAADVTASSADKVSGLTAFNGGVAFFNDSLGIHFTDGTTTTQLSTLTPVTLDAENTLFVEAGGILYYVVDQFGFGQELFSSTAAGVTGRVIDLFVGATGSDPRDLIEFNNRLFFTADHDDIGNIVVFGREVFSTDGTALGTELLEDINLDLAVPSGPITFGSFPDQLTVVGNKLFFTADNGTLGGNGRELWVSDGVFNSTTLVTDLRAGTASSSPTTLTDIGGTLYFAADDGTNGREPFKSDGTAAGTTLIANINGGNASSNPEHFLEVDGTVFFAATEALTGTELWETDGTPAGTSMVDDLQVGTASSNPIPLADTGSGRVLLSSVGSGTVDRELWIAGGVVSGVQLVADINPGAYFGSNPRDVVEIAPYRLLVADDGFAGEELFRLGEGTPEVESTVISNGAAQRSSLEQVTLTFNSVVTITGNPFSLVNTDTTDVVAVTPLVTTENEKTVVNFTFLPGPSVNANGLLLDGNYQLTVDASLISSFGFLLDGDGDGTTGDNYVFGNQAVDKFFRKFGDGDGSNLVNLFDFAGFRNAFGSSDGQPAWNEAYDNDGNDIVNLFDFAAFRNNFGT